MTLNTNIVLSIFCNLAFFVLLCYDDIGNDIDIYTVNGVQHENQRFGIYMAGRCSMFAVR